MAIESIYAVHGERGRKVLDSMVEEEVGIEDRNKVFGAGARASANSLRDLRPPQASLQQILD